MTQKKSEHQDIQHPSEKGRRKRINNAPHDLYDPDVPRLGRRESEPHSAEVSYMHDVLTTNFPNSRTIWDLHHFFMGEKGSLKREKIDILFDISFFKDLKIPHTLSSYRAEEHDGKKPDLVVNVLSKSTWRNDLSEVMDICKGLEIPVYVVFSPYKVTTKIYHPPFLRAYILQSNNTYKQEELNQVTLEEGGSINEEKIINLKDKLPFSLGLMKLKKNHKGKQDLYRLVFIDPSVPRVYPTELEKKLEEKDKIIEEKDKIIEEKNKTIEEKNKK
jgi:hypothetical protein